MIIINKQFVRTIFVSSVWLALNFTGLLTVTSYAEGVERTPIVKDALPTKTWQLPKIYGNHQSRYSIKYPDDWNVGDSMAGVLVIKGKANTPSYNSAINIQTINTSKNGGAYKNVGDFIGDIKTQVVSKFQNVRFVGDGNVILTQLDGKKAVGKYLIFIFNYRGMVLEQWQIVVERNDGNVFYTWAYTSPYAQYQRDLHIAKTMLDTWYIY